MTAIDDEVRLIENAGIPDRFARGWHNLGQLDDFRDGKPHTLLAFGQKLVIWADTKGEVHVLDAYCRHMGGDLSQGEVKGDEVACPFHDWRWGGDGKCKAIPYSKRVPLRARTATWPTMNHEGMLLVWNDPEGNPPIPEQTPPSLPMHNDPNWSDWEWHSFRIDNTNVRELMDNMVDMAHFFYIHKSFPTFFKNVFEGHTAWQWMNGERRGDVGDLEAIRAGEVNNSTYESEAAYYGPAFHLNPMVHKFPGFDVHTMLINSHYPIDNNSFMLNYALSVRKADFPNPEGADAMAQGMAVNLLKGFEQDVQIWINKSRIDNPLLCEEDGPVYQLRRWYEQFYVDVADISPEMTERFEFEIDTTRPTNAWRAEVAENIEKLLSSGAEH